MQNLKRALSLLLVVAMVMSFMLSASAATGDQLTDLSESSFQPEVRVLNALGIIEGYEDGTYKPANEVTRAELALILARVRVGGDKEMIASYNYGHMTYTDVLAYGYTWAAPGIQYCTDNGMVVGDGNGKYRPGDTVTIVEALKMLLTALGYDAEIEGLQNVGAAWKANTLSLAKEVGLMDRFYGDTNKNCTRDDIALLIYNFLMSDVVKGYFTNDVANVDTILYAGGTALEIYFEKQVIYGVVVANEAANLDVHEYAASSRVVDDDVTLGAGYTELFLYDAIDEYDYTLMDYMTGSHRGVALDEVFVTVKLTTGLSELGESVFIITDMEKTKGYYVAIGDLCFDTGVNEIGVEQWQAADLRGLVNSDTVYVNDYDVTASNGTDLLSGVSVGNGDFLKTVDYNGDGKLDFVMVEDWGMTFVLNTTKRGVINNYAGLSWTTGNVVTEVTPYTMVNFHYADGYYYTTDAETLSGLMLEDSNDAVNFKEGYVALTDGNKYYQSDVEVNGGAWVPVAYIDIMDCQYDPYDMTKYTWYLDNGGFIRCYGPDAAAYEMYLLTDATSEKTGRASYDKTVDTYKQSSDMVKYDVAYDDEAFVGDYDDRTWGGALDGKAIPGKSVTNLVAGAADDDSISLYDISKTDNTIVELQGVYNANAYTTTDAWGKYGDYNTNHGGNLSELVYTTTETDYYYVVLAEDKDGTYVKSVTYFEGYLNVKNFNFANCDVAYAAVEVETDANGQVYYYANAVVIEAHDSITTTTYPYFAYRHVSGNRDTKVGIYEAIDPDGVQTTYNVTSLSGAYMEDVFGALGFYTYNVDTGAADMIVQNWADYGISAHYVAIAKTGTVDYYVLDSQGGDQIKVTEETPVYAVMNGGTDKSGYPYWSVVEYTDKLAKGDMIVLVEDVAGINYILVFYAASYDLGWGESWAAYYDAAGEPSDAMNLWVKIATNGYLYSVTAKYDAFAAAVLAYAADKTDANFDAMVAAFDVWFETISDEIDFWYTYGTDPYVMSFLAYIGVTGGLLDSFDAFKLLVDESKVPGGGVYIDPYLFDLKELYDSFTDTQKDFFVKYYDGAQYIADYTELANSDVLTALALLEAAVNYTTATVPAEVQVAAEALANAYADYFAAGILSNGTAAYVVGTVSMTLPEAVALAQSLAGGF